MWIPSAKTKRFTLYHLQENQTYVKDFSGMCTYVDPLTRDEHIKEKGKFYICSKTIVFQADQQNIPVMKYKYEHLKAEPKVAIEGESKSNPPQKKPTGTEYITFVTTKITTIRSSTSTPPEPFKSYDDLSSRISIRVINIDIYPSYESVDKLMDWIITLYEYAKKKISFELQDNIHELMMKKQGKKGFNMSLIDSVAEKPLHEQANIFVRRILPLNHVYGYIFVTDAKVYFEPFHSLLGKSVHKIELSDIAKLFKRRFELRQVLIKIIQTGLEIITSTGKSYYFTFENTNHRNRLYSALSKKVPQKCLKVESLDRVTYLWQTKQISNYDYLMHLNQTGNRSFSDLSQYPVFPWVLTDYQSQELDLNDQKVYRDLSKPIGALNPHRLEHFLMRYQEMPAPRFMYGSHYSTPGYVIGYLLRKKPEYMLKLQSGRFDKPDRLFKSIEGDWKNVWENPTSLKELTPEFYQIDPTFLVNQMGLDLGVKQNGERVGDVKLPAWAKGDPKRFLQLMRAALQSEYVSNHLHEWIDLVFGYKQHGQQAIKANNVFMHITYEGMVDMDKIKDPLEKASLKCQINEFGQCPRQIFKMPHPARNALDSDSKMPESHNQRQDSDQQTELEKNSFTTIQSSKNSLKNMELSSLYSSTGKPKLKTVLSMGKTTDIKFSEIPKAHRMAITHITPLASRPNTVITISQDGFLKVVDLYDKNCQKSFKICEVCISAIAAIKPDELYALGSWDNNIYLFNIVSGNKSKPVVAHNNSISDLKYLTKRKRLLSSSWDCYIKMWRVVGSNLDNEEQFIDHDNQITSMAVDDEEICLAFGDIEGNVVSVNIEEKQKLFSVNIHNQKIVRLFFLHSNIVAGGQTDIRLLDNRGALMSAFVVEQKNGLITDLAMDGEHLFSITNKKHLGLYDIVEEKKLGSYFNDYRTSEDDKLPNEKELTCIAIANDSTVVAVGSSTGNLYVMRS